MTREFKHRTLHRQAPRQDIHEVFLYTDTADQAKEVCKFLNSKLSEKSRGQYAAADLTERFIATYRVATNNPDAFKSPDDAPVFTTFVRMIDGWNEDQKTYMAEIKAAQDLSGRKLVTHQRECEAAAAKRQRELDEQEN